MCVQLQCSRKHSGHTPYIQVVDTYVCICDKCTTVLHTHMW